MNAPAPSTPLTPEERALVLSVTGLVERAAYEVRRQYGEILPFNELVSIGHLAIVNAAKSYDPARSVPFSQWAFYRAMHGMIDGGRREQRHGIRGAARAAAFAFLARERRVNDEDPFAETDETLRDRLGEFSNGVLAAFLDGANAQAQATPEDAALAAETWERALAALREVIAGLSQEQQQLIQFCYVNGENLRRAAELQGVNYFTLLERHQAILKVMGARLRARGVQRTPASESEWPLVSERATSSRASET